MISFISKEKQAALSIGASSVLAVFAMLHHPSGQAFWDGSSSSEVAALVDAGMLVHGGIIFMIMVMLYAFLSFTEKLKSSGFNPQGGLIAFYGGYISFIVAASINGFIFPPLALEFSASTTEQQEILAVVARLCINANQYFAMFGTVLVGGAIALWSCSLLQIKGMVRGVGAAGIILGLCSIFAIVGGHLSLNVHGMTMIVVGFCSWQFAVAILMWRKMI